MKCKYKVRWFSSKGAFLVLLWTFLIFIVCTIQYYFYLSIIAVHFNQTLEWLLSVPALAVLLSTSLSGWLADAKFGNYKVFRAGAVLLFISTVLNCLLLILEELVWENNSVLKWIHLCLGSSLFVIGASACVVPALPLGLDQMPDASSTRSESYIAWFVCSIFVGGFLTQVLDLLGKRCLDNVTQSNYAMVCCLLATLCMTLILTSNFLFSPKWLIIEPNSPQTLRIIYQVLRFAAKQKAPINRSAFTYWEEDIPSRLDLGKSKYGGPFSTEQVEDVKTIFRLLAIIFSFSIITFSSIFLGDFPDQPKPYNYGQTNISDCEATATIMISYSGFWYGFLGFIIHEFLIYPFFQSKFPSILKRIGAVSLMVTLTSCVCLVLKLTSYYFPLANTAGLVANVINQSTRGILFENLLVLLLQFMSAQSPYHMRGLLLSLVVTLEIALVGVHVIIGHYYHKIICTQSWCNLVSYSLQSATCFIGFLLFCLMAHWYKRRVRDEEYSVQRAVEEVYDRYLTAAAAQSRTYNTNYNNTMPAT